MYLVTARPAIDLPVFEQKRVDGHLGSLQRPEQQSSLSVFDGDVVRPGGYKEDFAWTLLHGSEGQDGLLGKLNGTDWNEHVILEFKVFFKLSIKLEICISVSKGGKVIYIFMFIHTIKEQYTEKIPKNKNNNFIFPTLSNLLVLILVLSTKQLHNEF